MLQVEAIISHANFGYILSVELSSTESYSQVVVEHKERIISEEGDTLFYNKYEDNTYSFGLIQGDRKSFGHTKGYVWSSRASIINQFFGTKLIEVGIAYAGDGGITIHRAIDVDTLQDLLPSDFHVVEGQYNDGEIYHSVEPKDHREVKCGEVLYKRGKDTADTPVYNTTTIILNSNQPY